MEQVSLQQFLTWLVGGGFVIAASWILERMAWYQNLASNVKQWVFMGVAAVIGIASYAVSVYVPVDIIKSIAPYFAIIASVFSYLFLGTAYHKVDKKD